MRKMLGMTEALHTELKSLAESKRVPMTVVLETLLAHSDDIDWKSVEKNHKSEKLTWTKMRTTVSEYQAKYPNITDEDLVQFTGYSLAQVETLTFTAHKRVLEVMRDKRLKPATIAEKASVSERFALRMWQIREGLKEVPKQEQHIWDLYRSKEGL